jgi:hypothetical protein
MTERQESMVWCLAFSIMFVVASRGRIDNLFSAIVSVVFLLLALWYRLQSDE